MLHNTPSTHPEPSEPILDLLILGSGVAGLTAAVHAARKFGLRVGVVTKATAEYTATSWAQGGVAAVLSEEFDSIEQHFEDTIAAGAGLCDLEAVRVLVSEGPQRIRDLLAIGTHFDNDSTGAFDLAREGGHSHPRILHAGGTSTGKEIERSLLAEARENNVLIREHAFVTRLLKSDDTGITQNEEFIGVDTADLDDRHTAKFKESRCMGVEVLLPDGSREEIFAKHTLCAMGGAGQLYAITTNPLHVTGDGVSLALRHGVAVSDIEFMQFHPTALHHEVMPRLLLSEALRGYGAVIRGEDGERFVDELLPRDEVSFAIAKQIQHQQIKHVWLDVTHISDFSVRFNDLHQLLGNAGFDPATQWLPIVPAAHYLCGGIITDLFGATSLQGFWAAGEVACTGVHGANRLASNSLLEGMVFGYRAVEAIGEQCRFQLVGSDGDFQGLRDQEEGFTQKVAIAKSPILSRIHNNTGAMRSMYSVFGDSEPNDDVHVVPQYISGDDEYVTDTYVDGELIDANSFTVRTLITCMNIQTDVSQEMSLKLNGTVLSTTGLIDFDEKYRDLRIQLQGTLSLQAGVVRTDESLRIARTSIEKIAEQLIHDGQQVLVSWWSLANLVIVADALVCAAHHRLESRGCHRRDDFPTTRSSFQKRFILMHNDVYAE